MAQKEYLKMADVFSCEAKTHDYDTDIVICGYGAILESLSGHKVAKYAAHAINSHDELVAEVERLREHLKLCATELSAMIDRHNVHNMDDNSWLYDHQTPWEAMQLVK